MSHRIVTLIAAGVIGLTAVGLETTVITRAARGAGEVARSAEVVAVARAGRILAASLGRQAAGEARDLALDAALGVVRGASALLAAVQPRAAAAPVRVIEVRRVWTTNAVTDEDIEACCESKTERSTDS